MPLYWLKIANRGTSGLVQGRALWVVASLKKTTEPAGHE